MDLNVLKTKPKVRKFTLDSEQVIALFGEPVDFHIYWPMKIETFARVSTMSNMELVKELLVDKDGNKMFNDASDEVFDKIHHLIPAIAFAVFTEMGK